MLGQEQRGGPRSLWDGDESGIAEEKEPPKEDVQDFLEQINEGLSIKDRQNFPIYDVALV